MRRLRRSIGRLRRKGQPALTAHGITHAYNPLPHVGVIRFSIWYVCISACRSPTPSLLTPKDCGYSRCFCSVQFKLNFFLPLSASSSPVTASSAMEIYAPSCLCSLLKRLMNYTVKALPACHRTLFVPLRVSNPQPARFFYLLKTYGKLL